MVMKAHLIVVVACGLLGCHHDTADPLDGAGVDTIGDEDTGGADTGSVDTATGDTSAADSASQDTAGADTSEPESDTGELDLQSPDGAETASADTADTDAGIADTVEPDTDTVEPDTASADTVEPDTEIADTSPDDTFAADTSPDDTSQADTSPDDTYEADTYVPDTTPPDDCPADDTKLVAGACGCGVPDTDTDLDGLADCNDPAPNQAFAAPMTGAAGSRAPLEMHSKKLAAGGWDGRLYIGLINRNVNGVLETTYTAELLKPESVTKAPDGRPAIDGAWAPRLEFENDTADHGFHVSFCADPDYAQNPYRSDAVGVATPDGDHETYRIGIIGMDQGIDDELLVQGRGHVVIANPRSPNATIVRARLDGPLTPMRTVSNALLNQYEPSVTPDCRLVVWHGRVDNSVTSPAGVAMYSVNQTLRATQWSEPRSISDMYYVHGPGAATETLIAGVPFAERYPVAQQPMRSYDGTVIPPGEYVFGPYPWVSFDGSEIFFPASINFDGPARSAVTAVGQRTGWALQHLDGAVNPSRSNLIPDGGSVIFANNDVGLQVRAAYNANTLGDGRPLGINGYQRLFMIPIALTQSMWTSATVTGVDPFLETSRKGRYAFLLSHSGRYAEVDLHHIEDGQYVLYLPMNEQIARDPALTAQINQGAFTPAQTWAKKRLALAFDVDATPDVSGNHHHATLSNGAEFPYEHNNAVATFQAAVDLYRDNGTAMTGDAVAGDRIHGVVGNSIYFPGGSKVQTTLSAAARARLDAGRGSTYALWVKPLQAAGSYDLLKVAGLRIHLAGGVPQVSLGGVTLTGTAAPDDAWTHIAVTLSASGLTLLQDGEAQATASSVTALNLGSTVVVGPADSPDTATTLCLIDEVSISDVVRNQDELDDAALRLKTPPTSGAPAWTRPLPADLDVGELSPQLPVGTGSPSDAQVALGERLFFDELLSADNDHSCGSCHQPDLAWTDGLEKSMAIGTTPRNAPSLGNRLFSRAQFADGRAPSLEAQALDPIDDPLELGLGVDAALDRLNSHPEYPALFDAAFALDGAPINRAHLASAIAAFERTLLSANSRFDSRHHTPLELKGRGLFFGIARCSGCHQGANFTDERFHAIGFDVSEPAHEGRAAITGRPSDIGRFKTPSLRDVARTAPYFHDGSEATLADVVDFYNDGGDDLHGNRDFAIQPLGLSDADRDALVAFLKTLTGTTLATSDGVVTRPRIGGAGAPGGIWIVGLDYGPTPVVVFRDQAGTELATVPTADLNHVPSVTPPGWSGVWENVTLSPPAAVTARLDAGETVMVHVVNADGASEGHPLRQ